MIYTFLLRFAVFKNYLEFIKDIGIARFVITQILGALTGFLTILSLSSIFGVLALFITNSEEQILKKISAFWFAGYIPEIVKDHLIGSALFLAFAVLGFKLLASLGFSYYSTLFLENYARRIRLGILDRYFETFGMVEPEVKETEILYFNHQLLRFVSYYAALIKANLEIYNSIFLFSFLLFISPTLSIGSIISLGILFLLTRPIHSFSKRMGKEYNHFVFVVEQAINRITRGIEILKTNNGKEREFGELDRQNEGMIRKAIGMDLAERMILVVPEMMSLALILCVLSLQSHFEKSIIIAFLYSLLKLFGSLNQLNFLLNNALKLSSLPGEIHAFLDKWKSKPISATRIGRDIETIKKITFENLRLARGGKTIYSADQLILNRGECVQILGPNGCGKSSLVKAFLGLVPFQGHILVNDIDIQEISKEKLFEKVSYLPQRFYLFNETIIENLRIGNNAKLEEIETILHELGLDGFIKGLKNGLNTLISEDMKNLSGGQIQGISIARALLKRADVYILDEYGNNLDSVVREKVDVYLKQKIPSSIFILITHLPIQFVNKQVNFPGSSEHAHST